jgi:hypothetical protein
MVLESPLTNCNDEYRWYLLSQHNQDSHPFFKTQSNDHSLFDCGLTLCNHNKEEPHALLNCSSAPGPPVPTHLLPVSKLEEIMPLLLMIFAPRPIHHIQEVLLPVLSLRSASCPPSCRPTPSFCVLRHHPSLSPFFFLRQETKRNDLHRYSHSVSGDYSRANRKEGDKTWR